MQLNLDTITNPNHRVHKKSKDNKCPNDGEKPAQVVNTMTVAALLPFAHLHRQLKSTSYPV